GSLRFRLAPFDQFSGGVRVAVGDVNGDGIPDILTGAGAGAPGGHVKLFSGQDGTPLASFYAFGPGFTGGVSVALADVNGDGHADLVVGAGPGAGPHVKVIDGTKLSQVQADGQIADSAVLASFSAFGPGFQGGVNVAAGDLNHDGHADLAVGAGPGAGPQVVVIDGSKIGQAQADGQIAGGALLASFFAYDASFS